MLTQYIYMREARSIYCDANLLLDNVIKIMPSESESAPAWHVITTATPSTTTDGGK